MALGEPRLPTISCGEGFTLILQQEEKGPVIRCWGENNFGQLGFLKGIGVDGATIYLPGVESMKDVNMAAGAKHTLIVTNDKLYSMGDKRWGKLGHNLPYGMLRFPKGKGIANEPKIESCSSYENFSVAVSKKGQVLYAWGVSQQGSLGIDTFTVQPIAFTLPKVTGISARQRAIQVAVGSQHSIVLTSDGNVFTWGSGKNGRLGHGSVTNKSEPTRIEMFVGGTGHQVVQVAAGEAHSMVLDEKGQVYTWGAGSSGRLGLGGMGDHTSPQRVQALKHVYVTHISAGEDHSLAVTKLVDGVSLFMWGAGKYGKLGIGPITFQPIPEPVYKLVDEKLQVVEAVCGKTLTVCKVIGIDGVLSDKDGKVAKIELWAWGKCGYFFGKDDSWTTDVPAKLKYDYQSAGEASNVSQMIAAVNKEFKAKAVKVDSGDKHAIALCQGNVVTAWGENFRGQLGVGSVSIASTPMKIQLNHSIVDIACGAFHSLAVTSDGNLFSWGCNEFGQLGVNDKVNRLYPTLIQTLQGSNVRKVSAGGNHSAAVLGGTTIDELGEDAKRPQIAVWGSNSEGQLGIGRQRNKMQIHPEIVKGELFKVFLPKGNSSKNEKKYEEKDVKPYDFEISLGTNHTMVLAMEAVSKKAEYDTYLFSAGQNKNSQLGLGLRTVYEAKLRHVNEWEDFPKAYMESTTSRERYPFITLIAAGKNMSAAVVARKELYMWGELIGITTKRYIKPHKVLLNDAMPNKNNLSLAMHSIECVDISLGHEHALVVLKMNKNTHKILSWGTSSYGRLGVGNISKKKEAGEGDDAEDSPAEKDSASKKDYGPTEVSEHYLDDKSTPHVQESFRDCDRVATGERQSFAVNRKTGHVYAWGHAARGKLGLGDDVHVVTDPREIPVFDNKKEDRGRKHKGEAGAAAEEADTFDEASPFNESEGGKLFDTKHSPTNRRRPSSATARSAVTAKSSSSSSSSSSFSSAMPKKTAAAFIRELSSKNLLDLELKIDLLHAEYQKRFLHMIKSFDSLEERVKRAKLAIRLRLKEQGLSENDDSEELTQLMSSDHVGLGPLEQALGRLYLNPRLVFELFKYTHGIFKTLREKLKEAKRNNVGEEELQKISKQGDLWRGAAFEELVFTLYDLNEDADRRRFQVFFKLCVQYVLTPKESGETRVRDLIREDMPLWNLFSRAIRSGKSRTKIAATFNQLLCTRDLYAPIDAKTLVPQFDFAMYRFARDAISDLAEEEEEDIKEDDSVESPLQCCGKEFIRLITNGVDGKGGEDSFALHFQEAGQWLLDVIFLCIEETTLLFEQSMKAYAKARQALDVERVDFRVLAQRRFCMAFVKALVQVAIDTTHHRRIWAKFNDRAVKKQETENFVLHMLRSPMALANYFSERQQGKWTPPGTTEDLIAEPLYNKDNCRVYSALDEGHKDLEDFEAHRQKSIDGGEYEKYFGTAAYFFGGASRGARSRMAAVERALHRDHLVMRSTVKIRRIELKWDVQKLLRETCRIPQEQREPWELKRLDEEKFFEEFRVAPFFVERRSPIILDEGTRMWVPKGLGDILDRNVLPNSLGGDNKSSSPTTGGKAEKLPGRAQSLVHSISIEDCLIMFKILREKQCVDIMGSKTGEGAWKQMIHLFRREVERLKHSPELREQFEKTKNNLLIIKDIDSKTTVLLGDEKISEGHTSMLDPAMLYIRLEQIFKKQIRKLKSLQENIGNYHLALQEIRDATRRAKQGMGELDDIFVNVTGPHKDDVNSQLLQHQKMRDTWKKKGRAPREEGCLLTFGQNPLYRPNPISIVARRGGMQIKTYSQLVNKDGVNDCVACLCQFEYSVRDSILRRPQGDPTECCFCLLCPTICFSKEEFAKFFKNIRFVFLLTEKPRVFSMKITYNNQDDGEEEILLHTLISLGELDAHMRRQTDPSVDEKAPIMDAQPQSVFTTTHPLNYEEVVYNEKKAVHLDTSLFERPATQHKIYTRTRQNHLHRGFLIILFDPLGTTVRIPDTIPFTFSVEKLTEFLTKEFPPISTGFLAKMESVEAMKHKESVIPSQTISRNDEI